MGRDVQGAIMVLLGGTGIRLAINQQYLVLLQSKMRWPLIVACAFLLAMGLAMLVQWWRGATGDAHDGDAHDGDAHGERGHGVRVGWLLVLPLIAVNVISPRALGLDAVGRLASDRPRNVEATNHPLPPPRNGAVELPVWDFVSRAADTRTSTLNGVTVRLVGFAVRPDKRSTAPIALGRFSITCCAADAFVSTVGMHGPVDGLRPGSWVEVVGTWRPVDDPRARAEREPEMDVRIVRAIPEPTDPYE